MLARGVRGGTGCRLLTHGKNGIYLFCSTKRKLGFVLEF